MKMNMLLAIVAFTMALMMTVGCSNIQNNNEVPIDVTEKRK